MWKPYIDLKTCVECKELHSKIFPAEDVKKMVQWPKHLYCRCTFDGMDVLPDGYATQDGVNDADYWLTHKGKLPENYLTKKEARKIGWKDKKGNLADVAKGKIIGGNTYYNRLTNKKKQKFFSIPGM